MSVSAVFIRSDLTSVGERFGCASSSNAAEPAIIGVAPEVPPNAVVPVPVPASADTDAPGAPMSGLIALSLTLGPRAELETMFFTSGAAVVGSMVAVLPSEDAFRAFPSASVMV